MKKVLLLTISMLCFFSLIAQEDIEAEKEAIKKVIQSAYVDGLCNNGDLEAIDKGFHPGFNLLGIGEGNSMWNYTIYNWRESIKIKKQKGEYPVPEDKKVSLNYLMIDITGTAAVAKFEFYQNKKKKYVDYLSLYKFEDGWKIVNKIYYKFPEEKKKEKE